jgi:hypothetical protein
MEDRTIIEQVKAGDVDAFSHSASSFPRLAFDREPFSFPRVSVIENVIP